MTTILKEGHECILKLFYKDKSAKIHLREIARKTKLNENSASRFLNQLEKLHILESMKEGNLKKYAVRKNETVFAVFVYFDVQKLHALPAIRKNAIHYFLEHLQEKPIIALVFGSTAKNTYSERSDIDILLIVNKKIQTKDAEAYVDAQTALKISPIQINYREFEEELKLKHDHVVQSAVNTGFPVSNHITYYGAVYHERI